MLRISAAAGYALIAAMATMNLGRIASYGGRFVEAHGFLDETAEKLREIGSEGHALEADMRRVECLVLEGRPGEALELAEQAVARPGSSAGWPRSGPPLERWLGYALYQSGRAAEARSHFDVSLRLGREARAEYHVALTLRALAETSGGVTTESEELFERLGVVATPSAALP